MHLKKQIQILSACLFMLFTISSCTKEGDSSSPLQPATGQRIFITCEGLFGSGTGTISGYNRSNGAVSNDLFLAANGIPLGNIVQDMAIKDGKAYIVVNNANKIVVVDKNTFVQQAEISSINQPRYIVIKNNYAFITEWGSNSVKVIDLSSNSIVKTIPVGEGPEGMTELNGKIYVCNSGAFGTDTTVSVIDVTTQAITQTIHTGINPSQSGTDKNGKLWVICNGSFGAMNGTVEKINPATGTVETTLPLNTDGYQSRLTFNNAKDKCYINIGGVVKQVNIDTESVSDFLNRNVYSLSCDPEAGNLWVTDARDYISNGWVIRYNLTTAAAVDSFEAGVIPGNFCFEE